MLDLDGDGNPLDDILQTVKKVISWPTARRSAGG
jgi:hypothetical protein